MESYRMHFQKIVVKNHDINFAILNIFSIKFSRVKYIYTAVKHFILQI